LSIDGCGWWNVEGLRIENTDNPSNTDSTGHPAEISRSHDIVFRRNLVGKPNRYGNNGGIAANYDCHNILIEENELYDFHRNGIACFPETTDGCTVRRNYVNPRDYAPLPGVTRYGPNDGIVMYFAHNSVVENNIVEDPPGVAFGGAGSDNSYLGNVALNSSDGFGSGRHEQYGGNQTGVLFQNDVAVGCIDGFISRSSSGVKLLNDMAVNNGSVGFYSDNAYDRRNDSNCALLGYCWDVSPNVTVVDVLATNSVDSGFYLTNVDQYGALVLDHLNAFNNKPDYASGAAGRTNSTTVDPKLGTCLVWLPDGSPMKGAGQGGADIGASVLYRYHDGVLTSEPLWDRATGNFPCGAMVKGVNDIAGASCFDVHRRLNVNTSGCSFPAAY